MLYTTYQVSEDLMAPSRAWASAVAHWVRLLPPILQNPWTRHVGAVSDLTALNQVRHERPAWAIEHVVVDGAQVPVHEEVVDATPWCSLRHFVKEGTPRGPAMLVVAPLSGHFATLLRATVRTMLLDHDVYVTDWHNARDVPLDGGDLGLDDVVDHLIRFSEALGPGGHMMSVCQPCPVALAAVAIMSEDGNPATPRSLTLMAGPVDPRINPTAVNDLAMSHPLTWFEQTVITTVPARFRGRGRQVYPGFLQLAAFLSMNVGNHVKRQLDAYVDMVSADGVNAEVIRAFYEEYYAVLDLPAAFYLETVQRVFQNAELPRGVFTWRGRRVDLGEISETALLTVEGGHDDICGAGQTRAALDLCTGLPDKMKASWREPEVGHYGVFSGHRWEQNIYPVLRDFVASHNSKPRSTPTTVRATDAA
jgi:poly(3-hydroxybutyrate) depolymerase